MKLLYDDRELVRELLADKARLITENAELRKHLSELLATLKRWSEGLKQIQQNPQPARLPKVPVPAYMASEIDWAKMGMDEPKPEQLLQPQGVKR